MERLQSEVEQIDLESGPGPFTRIHLTAPGAEYAFLVQLVGAPGPGLFDRCVTFENPRPANEGLDPKAWQLGDWGSLLDASVLPHGDGWTLALEWAGRTGLRRLVWECPKVTVHRGPPIEEDPPTHVEQARDIRKRVKSALAGWNPDPALREVEMDEYPLDPPTISAAELFGFADARGFACPLHVDGRSRQQLVLELIARFARVYWRFHPCPHTSYAQIYQQLTQIEIPHAKIELIRERGSVYWGDFAEQCPECACEMDGIGLEGSWPPSGAVGIPRDPAEVALSQGRWSEEKAEQPDSPPRTQGPATSWGQRL